MTGPRLLAVPRCASVRSGPDGVPCEIDGQLVAHVRESWLIEDRWWTSRPLRRRYWELVTDGGHNIVAFHDLLGGRWFRQR
jgi:hypothetical protein